MSTKYYLSGWPSGFDTEAELKAYRRGLQDAGAMAEEPPLYPQTGSGGMITARYNHGRPLGLPDEW